MGARTITIRDRQYTELCTLIQQSVNNRGLIIYNGNDESEEVPFLCNITQVYHTSDHKSDTYTMDFCGWDEWESITVLDFQQLPSMKRHDLLVSHFHPATVQMWNANRDSFNDAGTIAVHVQGDDGTWFEHITTKCRK